MSKLKEFQKKHGLVNDGILGPLTADAIKRVFKIKSDEYLAHFIGQIAHETNNFRARVESFNYTPSGLIGTFSFYKRNKDLAYLHGRRRGFKANKIIIANLVYDDKNRSSGYKLGNVLSGDGWKFRGRGSIMITGRSNYEAFFKWLGICTKTDPDLVASVYYWEAALFFFETRNIWRYADRVTNYNVKKVTEIINPALHALEHRIDLTNHFYKVAKK